LFLVSKTIFLSFRPLKLLFFLQKTSFYRFPSPFSINILQFQGLLGFCGFNSRWLLAKRGVFAYLGRFSGEVPSLPVIILAFAPFYTEIRLIFHEKSFKADCFLGWFQAERCSFGSLQTIAFTSAASFYLNLNSKVGPQKTSFWSFLYIFLAELFRLWGWFKGQMCSILAPIALNKTWHVVFSLISSFLVQKACPRLDLGALRFVRLGAEFYLFKAWNLGTSSSVFRLAFAFVRPKFYVILRTIALSSKVWHHCSGNLWELRYNKSVI
jgi:hypothetical protein